MDSRHKNNKKNSYTHIFDKVLLTSYRLSLFLILILLKLDRARRRKSEISWMRGSTVLQCHLLRSSAPR